MNQGGKVCHGCKSPYHLLYRCPFREHKYKVCADYGHPEAKCPILENHQVPKGKGKGKKGAEEGKGGGAAAKGAGAKGKDAQVDLGYTCRNSDCRTWNFGGQWSGKCSKCGWTRPKNKTE